MRVVHIDTGREMRGGQWQVLALLKRLKAESILLARSGSPLLSEASQCGVDARPFSLLALAALTQHADLVHAHDARGHTWAALCSHKPLIVSRRVAFPVSRSLLSAWKYRRPCRFLAVSEFVAGVLEAAGIERHRIGVVYDGVEPPAAASPGGGGIVALATSDPMKGTDLVEAAISGEGMEVRYSTNLEQDLPTAELLLYLTRSEGLGSAALLAMAHGVPVVASHVGGLPEIVEDGVTGMLTDNDPPSVRRAIRAALARRVELGANARARVLERFTAAHMVENTLEEYRKALEC